MSETKVNHERQEDFHSRFFQNDSIRVVSASGGQDLSGSFNIINHNEIPNDARELLVWAGLAGVPDTQGQVLYKPDGGVNMVLLEADPSIGEYRMRNTCFLPLNGSDFFGYRAWSEAGSHGHAKIEIYGYRL